MDCKRIFLHYHFALAIKYYLKTAYESLLAKTSRKGEKNVGIGPYSAENFNAGEFSALSCSKC
jgi:hypothetical protein